MFNRNNNATKTLTNVNDIALRTQTPRQLQLRIVLRENYFKRIMPALRFNG